MKQIIRKLLFSLAVCGVLTNSTTTSTAAVSLAPADFNVRLYGAIPNDNINDTDAFQALAKNVGSGTTIRIPPGTYIVDNNGLNLNGKNDVIIEGTGAVLLPSAKWSGTGGGMFNFTNCSRIKVRGLIVQRNTSKFSGKAMQGLNFAGCDLLLVEDCHFYDCYDGVTIKDSKAWKVLRNSFIGTAYSAQKEAKYQLSSHGLAVYDISGESSSPHGDFSGNYGFQVGNLIYGQGADYCKVTGNGVQSSYDSSLYLRAKGGIISNNTVVMAGKDGIKNINPEGQKTIISNNIIDVSGLVRMDGGCGANAVGDNFVISGNQITLGTRKDQVISKGNYGVCLGGSNYAIIGNTVTGPSDSDGQSAGVAMFWSSYTGKTQSNIIISGNAFSNTFVGVVIPMDSLRVASYVTISNNIGKDIGVMVSAGGKSPTSNLTDITIKNNMGNFSQRAVVLQNVARFFLIGNEFKMDTPAYNVVEVSGCTDSEIWDNHVWNAKNKYVAFHVNDSSNIGYRNNYNDSLSLNAEKYVAGVTIRQ